MPNESEIINLMKKAKLDSEEKFQKYVDFYKKKFPEFYNKKIKLEFEILDDKDVEETPVVDVKNTETPKVEEKKVETPVIGENVEEPKIPSKETLVKKDTIKSELPSEEITIGEDEQKPPVVGIKKEVPVVEEKKFNDLLNEKVPPKIDDNEEQIDISAPSVEEKNTTSMEVNDFLEQKKKEIQQNPVDKEFNKLNNEVKQENLETKIETEPVPEVKESKKPETPEKPKKKSKIGLIIGLVVVGIGSIIGVLFFLGIL